MDHQPLSSHRSMCEDSLVFGPAQFVVVVCRLLSETAIWFQLSEVEIAYDRIMTRNVRWAWQGAVIRLLRSD